MSETSERDCNSCAEHTQGGHPPPLCQACLSLSMDPRSHPLLPFWRPMNLDRCGSTPLQVPPPPGAAVRAFTTGATRNSVKGRIDPEAFLSPAVLLRYCEYMNRNRQQPDGTERAGDNWQKGIPVEEYRKSIQRHNLELWAMTRDKDYKHPEGKGIEDVLCALMFNVMGMLHEELKVER